MTQEGTKEELLAMRRSAEEIERKIAELSFQLSAAQEALGLVVDEYGTKRVRLVLEELRAREMTWCTLCAQKSSFAVPAVFPAEEAVLLLLGDRKHSDSRSASISLKLYRACAQCAEEAFNRHGKSIGGSSTECVIFYAFLVEEREDGYYVHKFGIWVKVDEGYELGGPPRNLVDELATEWDFPPKIELDYKEPRSGGKLIIHEPRTPAGVV